MEINLKQLGSQEIESTTATKKMRLSENAQSMVFQMFTKNVYSNPIGTIVREITSNCFDSHVEAKVDSPVLLKHFVDDNTETHYISFIDYGMGMSKDRIENIYSVYFESTKRIDNTQIGGFGIGGKTPLAYKRSTGLGDNEYDNSFYVITTYDNIKYFYMIYEGEETPIVSLLHEEETTDHNGTEVRIPILEKDLDKFRNEITKQLYYFENLVFEGFNTDYNKLANEYKIVKAKTFLFRGTNLDQNIHLCLGRVAYPINYSALGLRSSDFRLPFAIRLDVGDINPTVSRESIDYSESTIELLKTKLDEVVEEMAGIVKSKYDNIKTLEDYFKLKDKYGYYHFDGIDTSINVREIINFSKLDFSNFKYSFMKIPSFNVLLELFFKTKSYGNKRAYGGNLANGINILNNNNVFYCPIEFNRKVIKQGFLASEYTKYHIITNKEILSGDYDTYELCNAFNCTDQSLFNHQKKTDDQGNEIYGFDRIGLSDFGKSIIELQNEMFVLLEKNLKDYDDVEVSEEFLEERRNKKEKISFEGVNFSVNSFTGTYFDSRYKTEFKTLEDFNGRIFYCTGENEYEFKTLIQIFNNLFPKVTLQSISYSGTISESYSGTISESYRYGNDRNTKKNNKSQILFLKVAKTNLKYMKALDNAFPIEDITPIFLRRKFDQLESYLTHEKIFNSYDGIDKFYKHENVQLIDTLTFRRMKLITMRVDAFKLKAGIGEINFSNFPNFHTFKELANITNIKVDKDVAKLQVRIDKIKEIQAKNKRTLDYLSIDIERIHRSSVSDRELEIEILKKLMKF